MASPELLTGLGAASAIFLSSAGSALASATSGIFAVKSNSGIQSFFPIIISGVLAIYGIIIAVLIAGRLENGVTETEGYRFLSAGLTVGFACFSSGIGMAKFVNSFMVHATPKSKPAPREGEQPLLGGDRASIEIGAPPVSMLVVLTFIEAIGLYGLIVALFLVGHSK